MRKGMGGGEEGPRGEGSGEGGPWDWSVKGGP